jgi:predicted secreted protein
MATRQGSLVRLYLYKAVWSLSWTGSGNYVLRCNDANTASMESDTTTVAQLQAQFDSLVGAGNSVVAGTDTVSPYTITFAADYLFSGIPIEVVSTTATTTVVARVFPSAPETHSEANGYYLMAAEYDLSKSMDLEIQDVTSKSSGGWKESVGQIRSWTLNPSHYFLTDGNFDALLNQYNLPQPVIICDVAPTETAGTQDNFFGIYNILNLTEQSSQNAVVDFTANFELTGEPTEVNAT